MPMQHIGLRRLYLVDGASPGRRNEDPGFQDAFYHRLK